MPAPITQDSSAVGSSSHFVTYAGVPGADIDLNAEGAGAACRRIRANAAGDIVVKRSSDNANVTLHFLAGEAVDVNASAIVAVGSTVNGITVFW